MRHNFVDVGQQFRGPGALAPRQRNEVDLGARGRLTLTQRRSGQDRRFLSPARKCAASDSFGVAATAAHARLRARPCRSTPDPRDEHAIHATQVCARNSKRSRLSGCLRDGCLPREPSFAARLHRAIARLVAAFRVPASQSAAISLHLSKAL